MLDFGQFDFGQFWPKSNCPKSNWPKSKLAEAEVEQMCLLVTSFSPSAFSLFLLISLFVLFLFCFCFHPQKPELNPKPQTLHPISDGPFRRTPPPPLR